MTQEDVEAVLAIEQAVQAYPWTRGNFSDALACGYVCCVYAENDEICGYAVLMPIADEAELLNIGVASVRQRKGTGRALLEEMLEYARYRKMRNIFLEVRPSNVAAIALYRSAGFSQIGIRRGYYRNASNNEDAVTMACELTQHSSLPQVGERPGARANG